MTAPSTPSLRTAFHRLDDQRFGGFVVDTANFSQRFVVEILVDGHPVRALRSDARSQELVRENLGDGCYGFSCALKLLDSAVVEARLANVGTSVGAPVAISASSKEMSHRSIGGTTRWLGGLRFTGWFAADKAEPTGNIVVDGILVSESRASRWSHVGTSEGDARAVRAFDFHLPKQFADGKAHRLVVVDDAGGDVGGGPVAFVAYADGLREAMAGLGLSEQEELRAQLLDRLLPMSVPFSDYRRCKERFPISYGPPVLISGGVIMVGNGGIDNTLVSLNEQTHDQWVAASLPRTQDPMGWPAELAREFLSGAAAACDFIVFTLGGTVFEPSALHRIANAFVDFPQAKLVYADVDLESQDGSIWPLAFPAFDYERMLEQGYCAYLFAMRYSTAQRALAAGASDLYRLFNSFLDDEIISNANIVHLPGPMATLPQFDKNAAGRTLAAAARAHLGQKGFQAEAAVRADGLLPAVKITRKYDRVFTAVIIPTRNRKHLLKKCIESVRPAVERAGAHIVVVDNDSSDPETVSYLTDIEGGIATVLRLAGEFSFSRLINYAAEAAQDDIICILDDAVNALDELWLDEMLSRSRNAMLGPSVRS